MPSHGRRCSEPLAVAMTTSEYVYEVGPRKDHRGVDLISDALPFGRLWYGEPNAISNAIGYAKFRSRSHDTVIGVYDEAGNAIANTRPPTAAMRSRNGPLCLSDACSNDFSMFYRSLIEQRPIQSYLSPAG
jgi:hypothetical protein